MSAHTTGDAGRTAILGEIAAERQRQVDVEGYGAEHDDQHTDGSIAKAAGCYAIMGAETGDWHRRKLSEEWWGFRFSLIRGLWPWEWRWFKPKDNRSDLIRAGALIVAEIERIDRATLAAAKGAGR